MFGWLKQWWQRTFSWRGGKGWRGFDAVDDVSVDDSDDWRDRQV